MVQVQPDETSGHEVLCGHDLITGVCNNTRNTATAITKRFLWYLWLTLEQLTTVEYMYIRKFKAVNKRIGTIAANLTSFYGNSCKLFVYVAHGCKLLVPSSCKLLVHSSFG